MVNLLIDLIKSHNRKFKDKRTYNANIKDNRKVDTGIGRGSSRGLKEKVDSQDIQVPTAGMKEPPSSIQISSQISAKIQIQYRLKNCNNEFSQQESHQPEADQLMMKH
nr:CLL_HP1_G0004550.mRNA.1.CDS.1 [Saccharomyces cerevisiae]